MTQSGWKLFCWTWLAFIAWPLSAQEQPATFEFSFSNPGARSLGLGGAFAALADDATAAFANPAGLVQLLDSELSAEGRMTSRKTEFVQGGRVAGSPSGLGVDTVDGLRFGVSQDERTDLTFASFVYPAERWSVALYRQLWADFDLTSRIDGLFGVEEDEEVRAGDIQARTSVRVTHSGLAGAFELGEKWSLGIGVVYFQARLDSIANEFTQPEEEFYDRSRFEADQLDTNYSHQADQSGFSWNAGLLWRATPHWSFGAYYRQGPRVTLRVVETAGPAEEELPAGTVALDETSPLDFPDVYGAGIAFRSPDGVWTVSAEWSRVLYSSITQGLDVDVLDPEQIVLDDGDELRLGFEYVFVRSRPVVALRLGAWLDPAHRVVASADADIFEEAVFSAGVDQTHLSGGLGLVFEQFQLDLGYDHSDRAQVASLSIVYRF